MAEMIFFLSLLLIFYIYAGYPLAAVCLGNLLQRNVRKEAIEPSVTILIAAYNEAGVIAATVANKLTLEYPHEKLEIIVISDGSTDRTDAIISGFADRNVRLLRQEPRAGKTSALNMAAPLAKGEIIVFSDANSLYAPDALRRLVANFADAEVGYVTGKMIYADPDGTPIGDGCTAYMKYENFLRSIETRLGSVVGVDGGIDAVRAALYRPMNADQLPDFVLPLKIVEQGYRVVYEPGAVLKEQTLKSYRDEYRMRVRVSLRALWALSDMSHLLSIRKYGLYSWQLFSHKHLRYMAYLFMISAYVANLLLLRDRPYYTYLFVAQSACYVSALVALLLEKTGFRFRPLFIPYYFTLINLASAHATYKFLRGQKQVLWTPRKG